MFASREVRQIMIDSLCDAPVQLRVIRSIPQTRNSEEFGHPSYYFRLFGLSHVYRTVLGILVKHATNQYEVIADIGNESTYFTLEQVLGIGAVWSGHSLVNPEIIILEGSENGV